MLVRSQKLSLSSPYSKISSALWKSKRLNCQKEKQNLQLRTKVQKIIQKKIPSQVDNIEVEMQIKFRKMTDKYQEQARWLQQINKEIDERHYEQLRKQVKKIENNLQRTTKKTLKFQNKLRRIYLKQKQKQMLQAEPEEQDVLELLQNDKNKLEKLLQIKNKQQQYLEISNKDLNREIISLLTIKNSLRDEAKKTITDSQTWTKSKVSVFKTDNLKNTVK